MIGVLGIILSLVLLMYLAYRGMSVIILAPILAMLAVLIAGDAPLLATYTQVFMKSMGGFAIKYFPIFLLGAIFGKLMEDSGAAKSIALAISNKLGDQHAVLAIVLSCGLLTYGGVSAFVVAFTVYPIPAALFKVANFPKRLVPAAIALGAFTFTMTCLPGTAQIHNLIPMPFFKTTAYAAPVVGIIAGSLMFIGGTLWLNFRIKRTTGNGEGYGENHINEPDAQSDQVLPPFAIAIIPILCVIGVNYTFTEYAIPSWDTSYLAEQLYGNTDVSKVRGLWAVIMALFTACIVTLIINFKRFQAVNRTMTNGAMGSLLPMFNTASEVGYGKTIATLAAFALVKSAMINVAPNNPLISEVLAVNVLAGITGSASGGLSIALAALGDTYYQMALQAGINPELMHRLASMASGGFDTLPHNGAVITLLTICGLTHKQSYKDIAMVSLGVPVTITLLTALVVSW